MSRFIHISDVHYSSLYGDFAGRLTERSGMDFTDRFKYGIRYILRNIPDIDFFLASGDLVHEGTAEEYSEFRRLWKSVCGLPLYTIPGNHDTDCYGPPYDREYRHAPSGLRILAMDSRGGAYDSGMLTDAQLTWLDKRLEGGGDRILMMHHTPCMDEENTFLRWQMENPEALYDVIKGRNVLAIFCGHSHKTYYSELGDIPCYTVDSITHDIDAGMESMTVNSRTGFHVCTYEQGKIEVRHMGIPATRHAELVIPYSELGAS